MQKKLPTTCSTGNSSCGGPGLCPGIALLIAYAVGSSVTVITGLSWLGWTIGIPLGLGLITGAWRYVPKIGRKRTGI